VHIEAGKSLESIGRVTNSTISVFHGVQVTASNFCSTNLHFGCCCNPALACPQSSEFYSFLSAFNWAVQAMVNIKILTPFKLHWQRQ